jgi:hypothetical protein
MAFFNPPNLIFIQSATTTTPPITPNLSDIYLVPSGSSGAWSTLTDKLVRYNGTSWDSVSPYDGVLVWSMDDTTFHLYKASTTSWIIPTSSGTSGLPVSDTTAIVKGSSDATKQLRFEVDGFTSGQTRVATPPNEDFTIVGLASTQTLTNKTINASNNTLSNIPESALSITDNTTGNVSSSAHGFAPKGDGSTTKFLNANGAYSVPAGTALTVTEEDNSPSVANVTEIRVTNGTLTNNGSGSVSINIAGGGSGAPTSAKYVVTEADGTLSAEIVIPSFASHPDIVPASPHAKDDEFNAGSLDGKWSWLNQGSSTATFGTTGWISINPQSSTWRCLMQAVPSGNWTLTAKLSAGFGFVNDGYAGIMLFGGTDGVGDAFCIGKDGAGSIATRGEQVSSYAFNGTRANTNVTWGGNLAYLRMVWDGTNIRYHISVDGIAYNRFTSYAPSYTPTKFGIATRSSDSQTSMFDWFRVT